MGLQPKDISLYELLGIAFFEALFWLIPPVHTSACSSPYTRTLTYWHYESIPGCPDWQYACSSLCLSGESEAKPIVKISHPNSIPYRLSQHSLATDLLSKYFLFWINLFTKCLKVIEAFCRLNYCLAFDKHKTVRYFAKMSTGMQISCALVFIADSLG